MLKLTKLYLAKQFFVVIYKQIILRLLLTLLQGSLDDGEGSSTVNIFVLTSLHQLPFLLKILFNFFTKQATLMRRIIVQSLSLQLVYPYKHSSLFVTRVGEKKY